MQTEYNCFSYTRDIITSQLKELKNSNRLRVQLFFFSVTFSRLNNPEFGLLSFLHALFSFTHTFFSMHVISSFQAGTNSFIAAFSLHWKKRSLKLCMSNLKSSHMVVSIQDGSILSTDGFKSCF